MDDVSAIALKMARGELGRIKKRMQKVADDEADRIKKDMGAEGVGSDLPEAVHVAIENSRRCELSMDVLSQAAACERALRRGDIAALAADALFLARILSEIVTEGRGRGLERGRDRQKAKHKAKVAKWQPVYKAQLAAGKSPQTARRHVVDHASGGEVSISWAEKHLK